jgi:hypothetical protein
LASSSASAGFSPSWRSVLSSCVSASTRVRTAHARGCG